MNFKPSRFGLLSFVELLVAAPAFSGSTSTDTDVPE